VFKFYRITNFRATDQRHVQAREMALQETNQQCHCGCCIYEHKLEQGPRQRRLLQRQMSHS